MSRHRYIYANDNPITYSDPSGKVSLSELTVVQLTAATLAGLGMGATIKQQVESQFYYTSSSDAMQWSGVLGTYTAPNIDRFFSTTGNRGRIFYLGFDADLFLVDSNSGGDFEYKRAPIIAISTSTGNANSPAITPGAITLTTFQVKTPSALGRDINTLSGGYVSGGFGASMPFFKSFGGTRSVQPLLLGNGRGDANGDAFAVGVDSGFYYGLKVGLSIALPSELQRVSPTPK